MKFRITAEVEIAVEPSGNQYELYDSDGDCLEKFDSLGDVLIALEDGMWSQDLFADVAPTVKEIK